jgi:hypothetical protein
MSHICRQDNARQAWHQDIPTRQFLPPEVRSFIDFLADRFGPDPYRDKGIA